MTYLKVVKIPMYRERYLLLLKNITENSKTYSEIIKVVDKAWTMTLLPLMNILKKKRFTTTIFMVVSKYFEFVTIFQVLNIQLM